MILRLSHIRETALGNSVTSTRAFQKKQRRLRRVGDLTKNQVIDDMAGI